MNTMNDHHFNTTNIEKKMCQITYDKLALLLKSNNDVQKINAALALTAYCDKFYNMSSARAQILPSRK